MIIKIKTTQELLACQAYWPTYAKYMRVGYHLNIDEIGEHDYDAASRLGYVSLLTRICGRHERNYPVSGYPMPSWRMHDGHSVVRIPKIRYNTVVPLALPN